MTTQNAAPVAIMMGNASDWPTVKEAYDTLRRFEITANVKAQSARRAPEGAGELARTAEERGVKAIFAAAGMAAHLAGALSARTTLPVIGIPMQGGAMNGLDVLLSTVQMPGGIPVATVAIGKTGAVNASLLAVQILALSDESLRAKLREHKASMRDGVAKANVALQQELTGA